MSETKEKDTEEFKLDKLHYFLFWIVVSLLWWSFKLWDAVPTDEEKKQMLIIIDKAEKYNQQEIARKKAEIARKKAEIAELELQLKDSNKTE